MDLLGEIGFDAGDVYSAGKDKETEVSDLKKKAKRDDKTFYMAVGWLAREGKVQLRKDKTKLFVKIIA